jgi:hypothetical protein
METITEESSRPVTPGEPTPMTPSAPSPSAVALRSPAGVGSRRRLVDPAASGRSNSSSKNEDSASDVTQRSLADNGKWSSKWSLQSVSKGTSGSLSPRMLAGGNGSGSVGGSERRPAGNAKEFVEAAPKAIGKRDSFGYLLAVVKGQRADAAGLDIPAPAARKDAWRETPRGVRLMAQQLAVPAYPDDTVDVWEARVLTAWRRAGEPVPKPPVEQVA